MVSLLEAEAMKLLSNIFTSRIKTVNNRIKIFNEKYASYNSQILYDKFQDLLEWETEEIKFPDINFNLAQYHYSQEDLDKSIQELNSGITKIKSGQESETPIGDYYLLRGKLKKQMGYGNEVIEKDFQKVYELEPQNVEAILGLVSVKLLSSKKEVIEEGIDLLLKALRIQSNNACLFVEYANQAKEDRNYKKAIRLYEEALKINQDKDIYFSKASSHAELGEFNIALKELDEALAIDPNFAMAQLIKANILGFENLGLAREIYEKINIEELEDIQKSYYWHNYAVVLCKLNFYLEALENVNQAITLNSNEINFLKTKCEILSTLNSRRKVIEVCDLILSINENDTVAYYKKAINYIYLEEYDKVFDLINKVFSLIDQENQSNSKKFFGSPIADNELLDNKYRKWLTEDLCNIFYQFFLQSYLNFVQEKAVTNAHTKIIEDFLESCHHNLNKHNIDFYFPIAALLQNIDQNQNNKNYIWLDILEKTLGKFRFRDGVYLLRNAIEYWESNNPQILEKLAVEEKDLVLKLQKNNK